MYLSEIPDFAIYPTVSGFVKYHLDMQFGDVRSMLRLPPPRPSHHACLQLRRGRRSVQLDQRDFSLALHANKPHKGGKREKEMDWFRGRFQAPA